jgi:hypothetical protein
MKFDILSASVFHCVRKLNLSLVMKLEVQRMSLCVCILLYIIQNSIFVTCNTIQVGEITDVIYIDINHNMLRPYSVIIACISVYLDAEFFRYCLHIWL